MTKKEIVRTISEKFSKEFSEEPAEKSKKRELPQPGRGRSGVDRPSERSKRCELTQLQCKEIVQWTFDAIVDTLVEDTREKLQSGDPNGPLGRIELRNFGVFEVKRRRARKARNPRTGEKVFVPEKFVVTFKPGKVMEERIQELEGEVTASRDGNSPAQPARETLGAAQ